MSATVRTLVIQLVDVYSNGFDLFLNELFYDTVTVFIFT
jgi:hypothetical protein